MKNKLFLVRSVVFCALCVMAFSAQAQIHVTTARIGCLDSPTANQGNLTALVASACNSKPSCSYKAPTPLEYQRAGVKATTRPFCTQAMEINYQCGSGPTKNVIVPGDAWYQPPAQLSCSPPLPKTGANPLARSQKMVKPLLGLLQKYKGCILEHYETQQDMRNRGLSPDLSGLTSTSGLQDRDITTCADGHQCSLASRREAYAELLAQANRGDPANFETKLESAVPTDCFQCAKHEERHTRHVHCTMDCGGNNGVFQGPCFEACKAPDELDKLLHDIVTDFGTISQWTW